MRSPAKKVLRKSTHSLRIGSKLGDRISLDCEKCGHRNTVEVAYDLGDLREARKTEAALRKLGHDVTILRTLK